MIFAGYDFMIAMGLSYVVVHVLLYLFALRSQRFFQSERGIFLYHFVSATVFTVVALLATFSHFSDAAFATAIGLIAIHCI